MMSFISQAVHFWQDSNTTTWLGVIVGIVTVITPIILYILSLHEQQRHKEISCRVRDDSSVIANKDAADKITILLGGIPVTDLYLLTLGVWNSGNMPINSEDYIHPILFKFPGRVVHYADIQTRVPDDLVTVEEAENFIDDNTHCRIERPDTVRLPALHLNSNSASGVQNSYTVRVLLTGPQAHTCIEGMLNEGKIVKFDAEHSYPRVRFVPHFTLYSSTLFVISVLFLSILLSIAHVPLIILIMLVGILSVFTAVINIARYSRKIRSRKAKVEC